MIWWSIFYVGKISLPSIDINNKDDVFSNYYYTIIKLGFEYSPQIYVRCIVLSGVYCCYLNSIVVVHDYVGNVTIISRYKVVYKLHTILPLCLKIKTNNYSFETTALVFFPPIFGAKICYTFHVRVFKHAYRFLLYFLYGR